MQFRTTLEPLVSDEGQVCHAIDPKPLHRGGRQGFTTPSLLGNDDVERKNFVLLLSLHSASSTITQRIIADREDSADLPVQVLIVEALQIVLPTRHLEIDREDASDRARAPQVTV
jgi:hypothetical protein